MIFDLPTSLEVGGRQWPINSDFRDVLRTLTAFEDPDVSDEEKAFICLHNTYPDLDDMPRGVHRPRQRGQRQAQPADDGLDPGREPDLPGGEQVRRV